MALDVLLDCISLPFHDSDNIEPVETAPKMSTVPVAGQDDWSRVYIACMATTKNNQLVMYDGVHRVLKLVSLSDLQTTETPLVHRTVRPEKKLIPVWMTTLSNGHIVMTTKTKAMLFLSVEEDCRQWTVKTDREYVGVLEGPDNTLIVSWYKRHRDPQQPDADGPDRVDMIRLDGTRIRRVLAKRYLPPRTCIVPVGCFDSHLFFSSSKPGRMLKVDIAQPANQSLCHLPDHFTCLKAVRDEKGNMYLADDTLRYILVMSPQGRFTKIMDGGQRRIRRKMFPYVFCLTKSGVAVAWTELMERMSTHVVLYEWP